MKQQRQEEKIFFEEEEVECGVRIVTLEHPRVPREFFFSLPSPIITVVMAVVGNARCVPICVRVRMPRASITRHPRGCLSIFNLSVESATLSRLARFHDRPRTEIGSKSRNGGRWRGLLPGIFRRLASRETGFISVRFCTLCHCAAASLLLPCLPRAADRSVFYTMLLASRYPPHFATYLFSSLRGGTKWEWE